MTARASFAADARALAAVVMLALAGCAPAGGALVVHLPGRAARGLDAIELCQNTAARLVMDKLDVGGGATLDVEMTSTPDDPCSYTVPKGNELGRGDYSVLVRFDTVLREQSACGAAGSKVIIGAFFSPRVTFPFPETFAGFKDADFKSTVGDDVPGLDFDADGDGRDNYTEVITATDPCSPNEPPAMTFTPESPLDALADESETFWDVESVDADDTPHQLVISVRHHNAGAGTPVATLTLPTDGGAPVVAPAADARGHEGWTLEAVGADSDDRPGAGAWRVRFVPDEPFVGVVDIALEARAGGASVGDGPTASATVADVPDPTVLLVDDNTALDFTEVTPDPALSGEIQDADALGRADTARLLIFDEDLGDDTSTDHLAVSSCPGRFSLDADGAGFLFTWAPDNDVAVSQTAAGIPCTFSFTDAGGAPIDDATLNLHVSPLVNDAPSVVTPDVSARTLPPPGFAEYTLSFLVVDPDQVPSAPACSATLVPTASTPCDPASAFDQIRCEALSQDGPRWTFALTLRPSATGYAACGERPGFDAGVVVTDVAPDENGAPIAVGPDDCTGSASEPATCVPPFALRTADLITASTLPADGGGLTGLTPSVMPLIEPASGTGLMAVDDDSFTSHLVLVDLDAATIAAVVPAADGKHFESDSIDRAAADPVNGRMLSLVRTDAGDLRALLVDLAAPLTSSSYTVIAPGDASVCNEPFNDSMGKPVVDVDGTFYLPCIGRAPSSPPARLVRIAPDGTRTAKDVTGARPPCSGCSNGDQFALVSSLADGKSWVVFPEQDGFVVVDLSTFDQATPTVVDLPMGGGFNGDDIWGSVVDAARGEYVFAYDSTGAAKLARITFDTGTPALDATELDLGSNISPGRLVLKADGAAPPEEPDVIVWPGSSSDDRTFVDLDAWSVTTTRSLFPGYPHSFATFGTGLVSSPDPRYAIAPNGCVQDPPALDNVSGAWFAPWDDTPPFFVDVGLGCNPSSEDVSAAGPYVVNAFGDAVVILAFPH